MPVKCLVKAIAHGKYLVNPSYDYGKDLITFVS